MSTRDEGLDSSWRAAGPCLRLGLALQCSALAWMVFAAPSSLNSLLFIELRASESLAHQLDQLLGALLVAAGLALALRPSWAAALSVGALFLLEAVARTLVGGGAFSSLSISASAVRWLSPLALALACCGARAPTSSVSRRRAAHWLLRLAVSATFATHGWEAWCRNPAFLDLILGAARRWTDWRPSELAAGDLLQLIGVMDLAVALALLCTRWRWLAAWAAAWGLATASSRSIAFGLDFLDETLVRSLNCAAPLALWLCWRTRRVESAHTDA